MKGTGISAPEIHVRLCGQEDVTLRFDHNQMRMSEIYYQWSTTRALGYIGIVNQLLNRTYIGMGAIAYGAAASAMIAAGSMPISERAFDERASYEELRAIAPELIRGVNESMPAAGKGKPEKNA